MYYAVCVCVCFINFLCALQMLQKAHILFATEQAAYNNPGRGATTLAKNKHSGKDHQPILSAAKLEAMVI